MIASIRHDSRVGRFDLYYFGRFEVQALSGQGRAGKFVNQEPFAGTRKARKNVFHSPPVVLRLARCLIVPYAMHYCVSIVTYYTGA